MANNFDFENEEDEQNVDLKFLDKLKPRIKIRKTKNIADKRLPDAIRNDLSLNKYFEDIESPDILENCFLIEETLPGLIISYMVKKGIPVAENELYEYILPHLSDLRKLEGGKYKGNFKKVINSTLSSSGLFAKVDKGFFNIKIDEAMTYVARGTAKLLNRYNGTDRLFLINKKRKRK
jgi:hypothetical protein